MLAAIILFGGSGAICEKDSSLPSPVLTPPFLGLGAGLPMTLYLGLGAVAR